MHYKETTYGFEYGAAEITRLCSDDKKGWVLFEVTTKKTSITFYITKTGKVGLYENGKEVKREKVSK